MRQVVSFLRTNRTMGCQFTHYRQPEPKEITVRVAQEGTTNKLVLQETSCLLRLHFEEAVNQMELSLTCAFLFSTLTDPLPAVGTVTFHEYALLSPTDALSPIGQSSTGSSDKITPKPGRLSSTRHERSAIKAKICDQVYSPSHL